MLRQYLQLTVLCTVVSTVYSNTNYRLNTTITPSAYSIIITPHLDTGDDKAFTFEGEMYITLTSAANIERITLHAEDLEFTASNITLTTGSTVINLHETNPLEFETRYAFAHINLASPISSGVEYILKITYTGPIRTDLVGFYRTFYIENGIKKWLGATQVGLTHARNVFPCFDEPQYKAVFTLTIDRPAHFQPTLTNTKLQTRIPLSNGYVREIFYPTPIMSTYLLAFLVSEFEAGSYSIGVNGTRELGIFTRPDAKNQTEYAFDFGLRVVEAMSDYFGIDYYSMNSNLKLDHIALPDFRWGAMENWGLPKYREAALLYVPDESSAVVKYRVAQIVAHETLHMWFGNLVTCHWWSNTWLNEGFANYFQDYITARIEPEVAADDMQVISSVYTALDADDTPNSAPITNENVNSPAQIIGHFGSISYQKAGSVIRMIHNLIGDNAFKFGLNYYLIANSFRTGYPQYLYSALEQGVSRFSSMSSYPGHDLTSLMSSWITRAGYPLLHVEVNYDDSTIVLTQKRFYRNSSFSSDEIYNIPITYTLETAFDFTNTKPAFIMANRTHVLSVKEIKENDSWPIFNIQETGLYRVNYDRHTWRLISEHLKGSRREEIHYLNRAKIVNDLFGLLFADEVKFELLHDVLQFLENETEFAVWFAAIRGLNRLRNMYLGSDTLTPIDEFAQRLIEGAVSRLGTEVKATDDFRTHRNRLQLLQFACRIDHEGCINNALSLYRDFKERGQWIHPSLRPAVYCTGLRFGNGEDYDLLWNRMVTTNVASEANVISGILGCSSDEASLKRYLVSMVGENSPIRTQDLTVPLSSVLSNHSNVNIVMDHLQQNVSLWKSIYTSLSSVVSTIASSLRTQADFDRFETWLTSCTECDESTVASGRAALNRAKEASDWAEARRNDIWSVLRSSAARASVSLLLIMTVFMLIQL